MNLLCGKAWLKKLRRSGYEMDDCGDGETALELLAAERYDLVLLDLNLPKVNGMTVLRTLRKTDLGNAGSDSVRPQRNFRQGGGAGRGCQ